MSRAGGRRIDPRSLLLTTISGACILGWAIPALLMLGKGFAVEDEGSYVLSYRYWHANPYFVSGSQYLYGPVFEALGESIPLLRLLRLATVIGVNAWFAACLVAWLDRRVPGPLPASRASLVLLLTAGGGLSYLWAPLTPGYYDLTADCALALTALLLLALARAPDPAVWISFTTGLVGAALVVTKWTALVVLLLVVGLTLTGLEGGSRSRLRYVAGVLVGFAVAVVAFQLYAVPVGRFATILWEVSRFTTGGPHGIPYLVRVGVLATGLLAISAVLIGIPLWAGLLGARAAQRRGDSGTARRWLVGGGVVTVVLPLLIGWRGGTGHGLAVTSAVLAGLVAAVLGVLLSGRRPLPGGRSGRLVAAALVLVPLLQAAGTNVPPFYVAGECLSMWMALVVMLVATARRDDVAVTAVLVGLLVAVVATAMIAGTTTLMSPFKTSSFREATAPVPGLGLKVAPSTAARYAALRRALASYLVPGTTPVLTLDERAGLTYVLEGTPAGSTWTDKWTPARTANILALACRHGDVARAPVLLVARPVDVHLAHALTACGFPYPGDYRRLAVPQGPPGLMVLVPTGTS